MDHLRAVAFAALIGLANPVSGDSIMLAQADNKSRGVIELMNQMEALNSDLNRLRGQIEILHNSIDSAHKRQKDMYLDLDSRLRRFEQDASPENQAKREKQSTDLDARLKRLEQDPNADGAKRDQQLTDLDARIKKLEQAVVGLSSSVSTISGAPSVGAVAAGAAPAAVATPAAPTPPVAPTVAKPSVVAAAPAAQDVVRRAYDNAMNHYKMGDYQGAVSAFDAFIKRHPSDALSSNAQYWIGDSYFNMLDFRSAAQAQQHLLKAYPDSAKVPDAMLNLGSAHAALNELKQARQTLEDLIAKHPSSEAADKARQRLARLK